MSGRSMRPVAVAGPGAGAGASAPLDKLPRVGYLEETSQAPQQLPKISKIEELVRGVLSRARPSTPEGSLTPMELAREEYDALRRDNMVMADECRAQAMQCEIVSAQNADLRQRLAEAERLLAERTVMLAAMKAHIQDAGSTLLKVIKAAEDAVSEIPREVRDFAPDASAPLAQVARGEVRRPEDGD